MRIKLILGLILSGLAVIIVTQNVAVVTIHLLFWTVQISLSVFAFILFAIGIAAGWLLNSYSMHRPKGAKHIP